LGKWIGSGFVPTNWYGFKYSRSWGNDGPIDYLNWLGFSSCNVLQYNGNDENDVTWPHLGGIYAWQRWGGAFNGLHMMLGYHTHMYYPCGTPAMFASKMLGCDGKGSLPIVLAWFDASHKTQPSGVVPAAMGPIGPLGLSDLWDYYPGKGSMGSSFLPRLGQIKGWWYWNDVTGYISP
jgi:hypothetical protein